MITGGKLDKNDHLYRVLSDHGSANGRDSWDPMLVQMALIGDEDAAGYTTVCGTARVDAQTGLNYFTRDEKGKHRFVVKKFENSYYEEQINNLL